MGAQRPPPMRRQQGRFLDFSWMASLRFRPSFLSHAGCSQSPSRLPEPGRMATGRAARERKAVERFTFGGFAKDEEVSDRGAGGHLVAAGSNRATTRSRGASPRPAASRACLAGLLALQVRPGAPLPQPTAAAAAAARRQPRALNRPLHPPASSLPTCPSWTSSRWSPARRRSRRVRRMLPMQ